MREGEGQGNQLYFEKSHSEDTCFCRFLTDVARTSLFQAFVVKKSIDDAIRPGRIWIEKVSFELSHVTRKRRLSPSERHRVSLLSLRL